MPVTIDDAIIGDGFTTGKPTTTYPFIQTSPSDARGRFVLVTGASRGIGRSIAVSYASAGAAGIAIASRSESVLEGVKAEILAAAKAAGVAETPKVLVLAVDVTIQASVEAIAQKVKDTFGRLDILINNAGYLAAHSPIAASDPAEWWKTFEVNVFSVYLMCRSFIPLLLETSEGLCTVVNISSVGAHHHTPGASAYETSKTTLIKFTDFIVSEYGPQGLLAYSVQPGGVVTELSKALPESMHHVLTDQPELAGDSLVWLAKERREWLAGRYISVQWDMEEFESRRKEIEDKNLLRIRLRV